MSETIGKDREGWPEFAERSAAEVRSMYEGAPENFQIALDLLAEDAPSHLIYYEVDDALGWPNGRFKSVFGGWRSHRGTESPRPFHMSPPWLSLSGEWEAWMDEVQARAVKAGRLTADR